MPENRWIQVIGAFLLIGAGLIFLSMNLGIMPQFAPLFWAAWLITGGVIFLAAHLVGRAHWWTLIVGCALIGPGLTIVLAEALQLPGEVAGGALLAVLGCGFGGVYLHDRRANWWALIPAGVMAALTAMVLLSTVARGELLGAIFFGGTGLVFLALYFAEIGGRRYNWWTLIPAGALFSLALVVLLSMLSPQAAGAALFLGLGLTFGVLYLMRGPGRPLQWAWIPAMALLGFGALILLVSGGPAGNLVWPLVIIALGLAILLASLRRTTS